MSLTIDQLSVTKGGRQVVTQASLRVEPGHTTAVLGANGAGKSELVLAIGGMLPISAGHVRADDQELTGAPPDRIRHAGVAIVPEGHKVLGRLTVDDNLRAAGSLLSKTDLPHTLQEVYGLFPELAERTGQLAGSMSGGQQQMLAIGHALMAKPKYLLIDEMSLGLAPLIVNRLVGTLRQLMAGGVGIILVEQFTEVALELADHAIVMRTGHVQFSGTSQQLKDDPSLLDQAYF